MRTPHPQILTCGKRVCAYAYNLPLNLCENMCAPYRRSGAASSRPMLPRGASSVLVGLRAAGSRQRARGGHRISLYVSIHALAPPSDPKEALQRGVSGGQGGGVGWGGGGWSDDAAAADRLSWLGVVVVVVVVAADRI